jgi:hypothetical protein
MLSAIPFEGIVTFWLLGNEHQPPSPYIHLLSLNIALDFFRLARYGVRFQVTVLKNSPITIITSTCPVASPVSVCLACTAPGGDRHLRCANEHM